MELAQFKKAVFKTLEIKPAKEGLRRIARKSATVNVAHSIVGLKTATGEMVKALEPYVLGMQLNDALRQEAKVKAGDVAYYLTVLAKVARVKMPSTNRKVQLKGKTLTKALLELDAIAVDLLDEYKETFIGHEINMEKVRELLAPFPLLLYGVCYQLFNEPIATIMDASYAHLTESYPQGFFDVPKAEPAAEAKPVAKAVTKEPAKASAKASATVKKAVPKAAPKVAIKKAKPAKQTEAVK